MYFGTNSSGNSSNLLTKIVSLCGKLTSWSPSGDDIVSTAKPLMRRSSRDNNTSQQPDYIKKIQEQEDQTKQRDIEKHYSSVSTEDIQGILYASLEGGDEMTSKILTKILQERNKEAYHEPLTTQETQILEDDGILQQHYRHLSTPEIRKKLHETVEDISNCAEEQKNFFNPIKKEEIFPTKKPQQSLTAEEQREATRFKRKKSVELNKTIEGLRNKQKILEDILSERIKQYINISSEKIKKALENSADRILTEKQSNAADIIQIIYYPTDTEQGILLRLKNEQETLKEAQRKTETDITPSSSG